MKEIVCPTCGTKNLEEAQFCQNCGARLFIICGRCGTYNSPTARFCIKCGSSLTEREVPGMPRGLLNKIIHEKKHLRGTRRKVAVMFADVSGFTSICEKLDPEEVTVLMDVLFKRFGEVIYKYEGYIDKYIGDSVMALFGAPVSHENDALSAVLCAMELMKEVELFNKTKLKELSGGLSGFQLSIGINFGEVIAGEVGSQFKFQYTVMGDVVNLAQRLQSRAPAGEIYVNKSIYELTNREVEYEELKPMKVKGKEELVIVYKPIGVRSRYALRRMRETPMIDRKEEFKRLLWCYEEVIKGRGNVIVIKGESGIGKTKLIYEFLKDILKRASKEPNFSKPLTIVARSNNYLRSAEGWVLKEFLRRFIGVEEGEKKEAISKKVNKFLKDSGEDGNLLFSHILKWVIGGGLKEEEVMRVEKMKKEDRDYILYKGICSILERMSERFPIVLVFDDLQWIDNSTRGFINTLVRSIERMRVMFIFIERIDEASKMQLPMENYIEIELKPFRESDMEDLLKTIIHVKEIDDVLKRFLFERSRGNPFYLEEHALMLVNEDLVEIKFNKAYLRGGFQDIPVRIEELILSRIDKLNNEERHVLEVASVIGQEFSIELLEHLVEDGGRLREVIKVLEEKDIIEDKGEKFGGYAFRHILIQRAVYNTLLKQRRREYHRRVGKIMEQVYRERIENYYELLSYHYRKAGDRRKYLEYLLKLGEREERHGDYRRAKEVYEEWVRNYGDVYGTGEGINVLLKLVRVNTHLGRYKEAMNELKRIELNSVELLKGEVYIRFLLEKSRILELQGKHDGSFKDAERALEFAVHQKDKELLALSYNKMGDVHYVKGEYGRALECYKKSLEIKLTVFGENHPYTALTYNNIGIVYEHKGEYEKALEFYKKALKIRLSVFGKYHPDTAITYNNIGVIYKDRGEYDKALEYYEKALGIWFSVFGKNHLNTAISYHNIGIIYRNKRDYKRALEYYKKSLEINLSIFGESHPNTASSYNSIGILYDEKGEYDKALEYYKKALGIRLSVFGESHPNTASSYNNIGVIYANRGEYDKALEYFKKALEIDLSIFGESHPNTASSYNNIGIIYVNKGEYDKALEYYKKTLGIWLSVFGENYPDTARCYYSISIIYKNKGEYGSAFKYYKKALQIFLSVFGENHLYTGETYQGIASLYYKFGEYEKALEFIEKAFRIKKEKLVEKHRDMAEMHLLFAKILFAKGKDEDAQFHLAKAREIAEKCNDKKLLEEIKKIN